MSVDETRELCNRLDAIIEHQHAILQILQTQDRQEAAGHIITAGKSQSLLELLVTQSVPISPQVTHEVTINNVTPTLLYRNDSLPFQRIEITNDDPAQMCWLGKRNVNPRIGRVLLAQVTVPYSMPQGDEIWAICVVATISLRISICYDMVGMTQVIAQ